MKLVGVMRVCDAFAEHVALTIEPFSRFCDNVCFLTHHVTRPEVTAAIQACANLLGTREYSQTAWHHQHQLVEAYHYAREFAPDWVIAPDHDEILPYPRLREAIDEAATREKWCVTFPFVHCWESIDRIVAPKLNRTGSHAKVYRGNDPDFAADPGGFCMAKGYWPRLYECPYPLRHCNSLTEVVRERRKRDRGFYESWAVPPPPTYPYREDWTYAQWLKETK